jgi:hypothetical protein
MLAHIQHVQQKNREWKFENEIRPANVVDYSLFVPFLPKGNGKLP